MKYAALLALSLLLSLSPPPSPARWMRANFHAHSAHDLLRDDGAESPQALHRAFRERETIDGAQLHERVKTVIFACVHNAGRSQMAAAYFNKFVGPDKGRPLSAGTRPGNRVHPEVVQVMQEGDRSP